MNNLNEFKALIKKYRSITLDEIKDVENEYVLSEFHGGTILNALTGFATHGSCTLCQAIKDMVDDHYDGFHPGLCKNCVWSYTDKKSADERKNFPYPCITMSYDLINEADCAEHLLEAVRFRADIMEGVLKFNGIKLDD